MTDPHRRRRGGGERGQATVELTLVLPVLVMALLLVVQVALVGRAQVLVAHAAREGARAAAVDPRPSVATAAARASPGLRPERMRVGLGGGRAAGDTVRVTVTYRAATDVPLVGALFGEPRLEASVAMRVEDPGAAAVP